MSLLTEPFYESANGDRWILVEDTESGAMVVRHQPNRPSGGRTSEMEVSDFLDLGGQGPEHASLRQLLETRAGGSG